MFAGRTSRDDIYRFDSDWIAFQEFFQLVLYLFTDGCLQWARRFPPARVVGHMPLGVCDSAASPCGLPVRASHSRSEHHGLVG